MLFPEKPTHPQAPNRTETALGTRLRGAFLVGVLLIPLGCGKKAGPGEVGASEALQSTEATEQGRSRGGRNALNDRLAEALPQGQTMTHVYQSEEEDDQLLYETGWARPGFPGNVAAFIVKKQGATVTVQVRGGEWVFEKGKLKKERATNDAPPQQWEWMQKRAAEVAEATYKASK